MLPNEEVWRRSDRRAVGAQKAVALASRFWGLGCPKIFHEVATHLWIKGYCADTVGLDAEKIRAYVKYQEKRERLAEQGKLRF
jgi:REP element-mobilizing transposase RayT